MTLTHGSLFTGIGGFDEAAEICGLENRFHSEIEKFPCQYLKQRFNTKNLGDMDTLEMQKEQTFYRRAFLVKTYLSQEISKEMAFLAIEVASSLKLFE